MEQNNTGAERSAPDFVFRDLKSPDLWQLIRVLSKLKIRECVSAVDPEIAAAADYKKPTMYDDSGNEVPLPRDRWTDAQVDAEMRAEMAEKELEWAILDVVMGNIGNCEHDINKLLAMGTGMSVDEIRALDANVYLELIVAYVSREGFRDFFTQALKSLQRVSNLKNTSGAIISASMR